MGKITNTSNLPTLEWLFGGNPNAIEAQEAEGQKEIVASQQLPRVCNSPRGINAAEQYHKMGIKVFTSSKGDNLFMGVKLPDGWKKEATDHSMWNNLVDAKGRIRATFFYKAAFYDRDAFVNFKTRYETQTDFSDPQTYSHQVVDTATKEILFQSGTYERQGKGDYFKLQAKFQKQCNDFLNHKFANWEDINANWEDINAYWD